MKEQLKKKRDLERTRKRIIKAAATEFAKNGLIGTRMEAVAKRAKVNKAMIYYIFKNKKFLHFSVIQDLFETKTEEINVKISNDTLTIEDILSMFNNYFNILQTLKKYAPIVINDLVSGATTIRQLKKKRPELFVIFNRLSIQLEQLIEKGVLRPIDPDMSIMMIIMILLSFSSMHPHIDLLVPKGSETYKKLSDPEEWKSFLIEMIVRFGIDVAH